MLGYGMSEDDIIGMGIPKYDITGEYKIRPTLPMQIDASYMRTNNIATYIWK